MANERQHWWGSYDFINEKCRLWHIGPLTLGVYRHNSEWQVARNYGEDRDDDDIAWDVTTTNSLSESLATDYSRYILRESTEQLTITPLLVPRPVISRPNIPFNLIAGEAITVYVSTPLWLGLSLGPTLPRVLDEIPIQRPSDTWFGPSTMEGELCYASTTHCRLNLEELPQRPHRAVTPVLIENQADTTLSVERLRIPAPLLSLYTTPAGQLWTPKITLVRTTDGDMAALNIDDKPPTEANQVEPVGKPRQHNEGGTLTRAFNAVFS